MTLRLSIQSEVGRLRRVSAVLGAVCSLVWIREPRASTLAVERAW